MSELTPKITEVTNPDTEAALYEAVQAAGDAGSMANTNSHDHMRYPGNGVVAYSEIIRGGGKHDMEAPSITTEKSPYNDRIDARKKSADGSVQYHVWTD